MQPSPSTPGTTLLPAAPESLGAIRDAVAETDGLPGLEPGTYARDHAVFEQRSDQRVLITQWLAARLALRNDGPLSVLSVGCGDGSVDVRLADAATRADASRPVRYVGVEPFDGSAARFAIALAGLHRPGLDVDVHVTTFDASPADETFDVITFVHSMYYVPDVAAALHAAYERLKPGGELLVLSAPRGVLNQLASALAPPVDGHQQWFSDDVADAFVEAGLEPDEVGTLDARVDLTDASTDVLDFTVQARLDARIRALVLTYLDEVALPGPALLLPHPVDTYRVTRTG